MKEKPMLFSGSMVRAILDGSKTQTRRVVKPQPVTGEIKSVAGGRFVLEKWPKCERDFSNFGRCESIQCPYGQPGDRLWVRENFTSYRAKTPAEEIKTAAIVKRFEVGKCKDIAQLAREIPTSTGVLTYLYAADFGDWAYDLDSDLGPWKPSIHMPRRACRITLEITGVRVEWLNDITKNDAISEGVEKRMAGNIAMWRDYSGGDEVFGLSPIESYKSLWESISGKGSWAENPWVWVIEFKKL